MLFCQDVVERLFLTDISQQTLVSSDPLQNKTNKFYCDEDFCKSLDGMKKTGISNLNFTLVSLNEANIFYVLSHSFNLIALGNGQFRAKMISTS